MTLVRCDVHGAVRRPRVEVATYPASQGGRIWLGSRRSAATCRSAPRPHYVGSGCAPGAAGRLHGCAVGDGTLRGRSGHGRLTERDVEMLAWLARQRVATAMQVARLFEVDLSKAYRRLRAMVARGLVRHERVFHLQPGVYLATGSGIAFAGAELSAAKLDIRTLRHDLIVTEVCVSYLRRGLVVTTEREMRAVDSRGERPQYAARLVGEAARGGLHFADLLAHEAGGLRAIEVELTPKRRHRLDQIIGAYVRARHLAGVVYYVRTRQVERLVREAAARAHAVELVEVQRLGAAGVDVQDAA
jgi:Sugar-specific transcriptional regulator TrmB